MLTLKAALEEATVAIGRVVAHVLVAHLLGVDRTYLIAHPMRVLTETEDARIDMLAAQRALGRPVAYLLNRREFYGRDFALDSSVLIPRPETETLVEAALARMAPRDTLLDLGTGSGAVAITIACQRPGSRIVATDVSAAALAVARGNAEHHRCSDRVEFVEGRWYEPLGNRTFDVIVSNPPYVAAGDPHLGRGDLRFEPRQALADGSPDGLASIRAIVAGASDHLKPNGWLLFEHGYDQAEAVHALLEAAGFGSIISLPDLAGIPRVAGGKIK